MRHLSESQRAMVAARLATMKQGARTDISPIGGTSQSEAASMLNVGKRSVERGANQHAQICAPSQSDAASMLNVGTASIDAVSQDKAAELLNVGRASVQRSRTVQEQGAPELVAAVESGAVSVSAAADVATLPMAEQSQIVARGEREILDAAKRIRSEKAVVRAAELAAIKRAQPSLPEGKYECIVIDPPWDMEKIERDVRGKAGDAAGRAEEVSFANWRSCIAVRSRIHAQRRQAQRRARRESACLS